MEKYKDKVVIGDCTLYLGDCMDVMPLLGKVDAVVTDPPYGIDVGSMSMGKGKKANSFESFGWDFSPADNISISHILEISNYQVIWGGNYFSLPPSGSWLAWDKIQSFSGADLEMAWTNLSSPTKSFRLSRVEAYSNGKQHPTEKPLRLMMWCLDRLPGCVNQILDPFMGSGTTGVACVKMGRSFVGIELDKQYFDIACQRIRDAYAQPDMFL